MTIFHINCKDIAVATPHIKPSKYDSPLVPKSPHGLGDKWRMAVGRNKHF